MEWELYATGFEGEHITDPTFIQIQTMISGYL